MNVSAVIHHAANNQSMYSDKKYRSEYPSMSVFHSLTKHYNLQMQNFMPTNIALLTLSTQLNTVGSIREHYKCRNISFKPNLHINIRLPTYQ